MTRAIVRTHLTGEFTLNRALIVSFWCHADFCGRTVQEGHLTIFNGVVMAHH